MCKTFPFWELELAMSNHGPKVSEHRHRRSEYGNPVYSWISIVVLSVFAFGVLGSFWTTRHPEQSFEAQMRRWKNWPSTKGRSSDTRVVEKLYVEEHAQVTVIRSYEGECRVEYSVAGKEYSVWAGADQDSDYMSLTRRMRTCPFTFDVHYDPSQPWIAQAFIANHP